MDSGEFIETVISHEEVLAKGVLPQVPPQIEVGSDNICLVLSQLPKCHPILG